MSSNFNPHDWIKSSEETEPKPKQSAPQPAPQTNQNPDDLESLVYAVEEHQTDLSFNYERWVNIGFALSDHLGESGREYFHRLSQFHPEYEYEECNRQYNYCLRSNGSGVTISTLYHYVKEAGIELPKPPVQTASQPVEAKPDVLPENEAKEQAPTLPNEAFENLPAFLQSVVNLAETTEERDILFLGSITILSSCLPQFYGIYHNRKVYANLFLFITAQASAGKGRLNHCRQLVLPIHKSLRQLSNAMNEEYEREMAEYNAIKNKNPNTEKPSKPPERLLFLPANSSSAGVFQLLDENNGRGLIFETEGDTLAQAFKSDFGNYSDGFRRAFHHETINYYRKTNREYIDIEEPCLPKTDSSAAFSSTV